MEKLIETETSISIYRERKINRYRKIDIELGTYRGKIIDRDQIQIGNNGGIRAYRQASGSIALYGLSGYVTWLSEETPPLALLPLFFSTFPMPDPNPRAH